MIVKLSKKKLLILQLIVFIVFTGSVFYLASHFPNLPPMLRVILPKNTITISHGETDQPDKRFLEWFDRDPERKIPTNPSILVSPADGYVAAIIDNIDSKHVVIEMRYTDVHVQRFPMDGEIMKIEGEGKVLPADMVTTEYALSKMLPFQKVTTLSTDIGEIKIRQITSYFAKRIQVFAKEGDFVKRGQRLGRILAGSTIVIEMPGNVNIKVVMNQDVIGGETIIAGY